MVCWPFVLGWNKENIPDCCCLRSWWVWTWCTVYSFGLFIHRALKLRCTGSRDGWFAVSKRLSRLGLFSSVQKNKRGYLQISFWMCAWGRMFSLVQSLDPGFGISESEVIHLEFKWEHVSSLTDSESLEFSVPESCRDSVSDFIKNWIKYISGYKGTWGMRVLCWGRLSIYDTAHTNVKMTLCCTSFVFLYLRYQ